MESDKTTRELTLDELDNASIADAGVKMKLFTRDGEPTTSWLLIRGVDSDAWRRAEIRFHRSRLNTVAKLTDEEKDPEARQEKAIDAEMAEYLERATVLVAGWSFPEPCIKETVKKTLAKNPHLQDQIISFAGNRASFFSIAQANSAASPSTNSG